MGDGPSVVFATVDDAFQVDGYTLIVTALPKDFPSLQPGDELVVDVVDQPLATVVIRRFAEPFVVPALATPAVGLLVTWVGPRLSEGLLRGAQLCCMTSLTGANPPAGVATVLHFLNHKAHGRIRRHLVIDWAKGLIDLRIGDEIVVECVDHPPAKALVKGLSSIRNEQRLELYALHIAWTSLRPPDGSLPGARFHKAVAPG